MKCWNILCCMLEVEGNKQWVELGSLVLQQADGLFFHFFVVTLMTLDLAKLVGLR